MGDNRIIGKIVIFGQIECLSPIHIGSGKSARSDVDIIINSEGAAFIPATSFVGILRHAFENSFSNEFKSDKRFNNFWGFAEESDGCQSALCCSDLSFVNNELGQIIIRDGIRINNENGIVRKGGKFDFELLDRGSKFEFKMEFTLRNDHEEFVKNTVRGIYELFCKQDIRLGAKTNNGLGKVRLNEETTRIYSFDFTNKSDVFKWLTQNFQQKEPINVESFSNILKMPEDRFRINLAIKLKNSLIIRSADIDETLFYGNESTNANHEEEDYSLIPDATQLKSGDDWVIPGSSLKGAIRARAEKIVNTLKLNKGEELITKLFGNVDDTLRSENAVKGKMRIEEITISDDDFPAELQARTKLDRFTGGVINGGLFNSMPIFATSDDKQINLQIEIENYEANEAGLLLLLIKDLWSGDLAIGGEKNIGRGVFQGMRAEITWEDKKILLESDLAKLSDDEKTELQNFIVALNRSVHDGL